MTFEQFKAIVDSITYKNNWGLSVIEDYDVCVLKILHCTTCVETGSGTRIVGRYTIDLRGIRTEELAVRILFDYLRQTEEHETKEWFKYKGKHVYDPHPELTVGLPKLSLKEAA